jgi:Mrp family chromosome partitioning ATPase
MIRDSLLALGLLLSTASQLRPAGLPIGPGEVCLLIWVVLMLGEMGALLHAKMTPALSRMLLFWIFFSISLCLGSATAYAISDIHDPNLFIHDILAYAILFAVSLLCTVGPAAGCHIHRAAWLLTMFSTIFLGIQLLSAWSIVAIPGTDPWYWERFRGLSENPNQLAIFCAVITFLSVHFIEHVAGLHRKIIASLCAILSIYVGRLTKSDTYAVILVTGILLFAALKLRSWLVMSRHNASLRRATTGIALVSLPMVAATAFLFTSMIEAESFDLMMDMAKGTRKETSETANIRLNAWRRAIDLEDLNRHLRVAQEDRSRVIVIRYTSRSPEESAIVVNKTVQLYIDGQNDQKSKYASRELALLRERIADARNTAMQSAAAVQKEARDQSQASQDPNSEKAQEANTRFHALERDAAASALIYSNLRKREREILDQRGDIGSIARIVSLATPPSQPSSHNPILFILPILIILLIGGSFIAVVMEQGDRGLRSERDVKDALGIPCVGFIPRLSDIRNVKPHQHMLTEPFSAYTESIRSVVGELWLTTPQRAPRTVLISSSVPGEGKTTAAVSIAVCAASLGRRVLMIDLDFKRPSVARELGNSTAGEIFDVLLRNQSVADITTHIPDLGIDYLAMPTSPLDALPVLADQRLPVLLRELGKNYDSIIIDGPPILGIVESRLLASMADKVVFVVKWGSTRREVAQNAISLLRAPNRRADGIDIPIALLTQVDLKMHASYRYGDAGEALVTYENYYSRPNQS